MTATDVVARCTGCQFSIYQRTDGTWHLVYAEQADTASCAAPGGVPSATWMEDRRPHTPQLCTRDPGHGLAEVPWSGERLCLDCADAALDLLAKACERELPVTVGKGVTTPGFAYELRWPESCTDENGHATPTAIFAMAQRKADAESCLVEDVVAAVMAAAGGDPVLAEELIRDMKYLKQVNCC